MAATRTTSTTSAAPRNSQPKGINYVDVGTSGGVWGLERGYCMMIGGPRDAVATSRPDLQDHRPRHRRHSAHPRPRGDRRHRGAGLPALRRERRRPLRQDGAQRHRVRHDGRLRRRPRRAQGRQHRQAHRQRSTPRPRRCAIPSTTVRLQPARDHRSLAARQRHRFLAARPDAPLHWRRIRTSPSSADASPTQAKAAGRSRPPSTKACRRRC